MCWLYIECTKHSEACGGLEMKHIIKVYGVQGWFVYSLSTMLLFGFVCAEQLDHDCFSSISVSPTCSVSILYSLCRGKWCFHSYLFICKTGIETRSHFHSLPALLIYRLLFYWQECWTDALGGIILQLAYPIWTSHDHITLNNRLQSHSGRFDFKTNRTKPYTLYGRCVPMTVSFSILSFCALINKICILNLFIDSWRSVC